MAVQGSRRLYLSVAVVLSTGSSQNTSANAFVSLQSSFSLHNRRLNPLLQHDSPSSRNTRQESNTSLRATGLEGGAGDLWTSYLQALETDPLLTKSITAGVILGAADLAGQALQRSDAGKSSQSGLDIARFLRFAFFGFILQAPWNHFYYLMLDGALPPTEDPFTATTGIKVVIDQFVQAPIFTVIIFGFLGVLEGKTLDDIKRQLDEDYADTMLANWKLWVPATVVNIAFCPPILRVLFLNIVFFFWSIFLSLKLNKNEAVYEEIE